MPKVCFQLNGQNFDIMCSEGEENRIRALAKNLDTRVEAISRTFMGASDSYILAITALMMEDEIRSIQDNKTTPIQSNDDDRVSPFEIDEKLCELLDPVASTIEKLATRLENA